MDDCGVGYENHFSSCKVLERVEAFETATKFDHDDSLNVATMDQKYVFSNTGKRANFIFTLSRLKEVANSQKTMYSPKWFCQQLLQIGSVMTSQRILSHTCFKEKRCGWKTNKKLNYQNDTIDGIGSDCSRMRGSLGGNNFYEGNEFNCKTIYLFTMHYFWYPVTIETHQQHLHTLIWTTVLNLYWEYKGFAVDVVE